MRDELERAYEAGDHRRACALAHRLARTTEDPALAAAAQSVLQRTRPDPFLAWVGALGLGLVAWLVYNFKW